MRPVLMCDPSKSRVQQHFRESCNVNTIVAKARVHGLPAPRGQGFFGNFIGVDFTAMQNTVCQAKEAFAALPSKVRSRFQNDPANLVDFVQNPDNFDEAVRLGICNPKPKVAENPIPKPVENPPAQTV